MKSASISGLKESQNNPESSNNLVHFYLSPDFVTLLTIIQTSNPMTNLHARQQVVERHHAGTHGSSFFALEFLAPRKDTRILDSDKDL